MMAALSLFLALVLATSAAHKALAPHRMVEATGALLGVSPVAGQLLMVLAGGVEGIAALCLLVPALMPFGAGLGATLWAGYALALLRRHGKVLDCGCDLAVRSKPVGPAQILRPAMLSALALLLSTLPVAAPDIVSIFAAAGFFALWLSASEILSIPAPAWRK